MANLIAASVNETASADFTLTAGQSTTLSLMNATGAPLPALPTALIQLKGSGGQYVLVGSLTGVVPQQVLSAIGTFRVVKLASATAVGVDRD